MYYGELCIKVENKRDEHSLTFYTRKRQQYVLPEGEEVRVGESIRIVSNDSDMIVTLLLDMYTIVRQGTLQKIRTQENGNIWTLRPTATFNIMSGPVIMDFVSRGDYFTIDASTYVDDSMEPKSMGTIKATNTGNVSLLQKILSALQIYGISADDAKNYAYSMREDY